MITDLVNYLFSDDTAQRQQAAIELSQRQDARLIPHLLKALDDPDSTVRANAAAGLGHNRAQEAVEPLIEHLLGDEHDIVRERCAAALAQIGDTRAVPALIDALDDPAAWTRNRVIYVLGASRDQRAVEPLIVLLDHDDPSTRGVAAWALGAVGDTRAYEPLQGLLRDTVDSVRGNAAWALGELADVRAVPALILCLGDASPQVRGKSAWALGSLGELTGDTSMIEPLVALLDDFAEVPDASAHVFVCQYAAEALMQIGTDEALAAVEKWRPMAREKLLPKRINDLINVFKRKDLQSREQAMQQLAEIGGEAVPQLIEALQHQNSRVRQGAAQTLGLLGDDRAVYPLSAALADPDEGVWSQTVAALARLTSSDILRTALKSQKKRVRQGAAIALWRIKRHEEAFRVLLSALQDEEILVRSSALNSLWMQPDERALATLQIRLSEEPAMMQRYILQALQALGTPAANVTIANWLSENT